MAAFSTIITVVAIAASVAAAGVSAYSAQQQASAAKKASKYNQEVAANNARLKTLQSMYDADRVRDRNRRLAATQRVNLAKSGVSIVSGSAFALQEDQEMQSEFDYLTTLYRGKVEATGEKAKIPYYQMQAENAQAQANISSAGAILGGLSSAGGQASTLVDVEV